MRYTAEAVLTPSSAAQVSNFLEYHMLEAFIVRRDTRVISPFHIHTSTLFAVACTVIFLHWLGDIENIGLNIANTSTPEKGTGFAFLPLESNANVNRVKYASHTGYHVPSLLWP